VNQPAYLGAGQGYPGYPGYPQPAGGGRGKGIWIGLGALAMVLVLGGAGAIVVTSMRGDDAGSGTTSANGPASSASPPASASPSTGFADGQQVESGNLKVGDCVKAKADGDVSNLKPVPCTTAHSGEVVGMYKIAGNTFPGETAITDEAERRCNDLTPENVADHSELVLYYLYPQKDAWALGDREVRCLVVSEGVPLTKKIAKL
jgi:hypothetical protein